MLQNILPCVVRCLNGVNQASSLVVPYDDPEATDNAIGILWSLPGH